MDYENTQIKKNNEDNQLFNNFIELIKRAKQKKEKNNNKNSVIFIPKDYLLKINELMCKIKWTDLLEQKGNEIGINSIIVQDPDLNTDYCIEYDLQTKDILIYPEADLYKNNDLCKNDEHSSNNIKEEEDMLKILENYQIKKETEIENKYNKQLKDLTDNDPVTFLLKQTEEAIKEMLNSENVRLIINSDVFEFTKETADKRNEIINTIREEKQKLRTKISEIESLLELAPNYEEKLQILRDYDIMDKKKNIIL